jgi:hypothetical protein
MGAFDHIILLLSFVYALAIAHLLSTTAMLIRNSGLVRFSTAHAFWMLIALITIIANWIGFWDLRTLPSWSVATIFFTFAMAAANYLQAALVSPEVVTGEPLDLVEFQARQRLRILGSFAASGVFALIANAVYGAVFGAVTWGAENIAVAPMLLGTVIAMIWRARWAQLIGPLAVSGGWLFYFLDLQGAVR